MWFLFALAFLISMAWGVLVALAAERAPLPKPDAVARPAAEGASHDPGPPLRPVNVVYRHAEGTMLRGPRGVFVDPKSGEIYVADTANNLVAVFDHNGLPLFSFGFNREFAEPRKAIADSQGRVYVLGGIPPRVKVFSLWGEHIEDVRFGPGRKGKPVMITAMAVDRSGNLYFGDTGNREVLIFGPDRRLKSRFETVEGERVTDVSAIAVADNGEIYVADSRGTPAIRVFTPEGRFLRGWGEHASGPQNFSLPSGIALVSDRVVVVDTLRHTISSFSPSGTFLRRDGGYGPWPGAVSFPADIAADVKGRVYVVEREGNRLQVLAPYSSANGRADRERGEAIRQTLESSSDRLQVRTQVKEVMRSMQAE